MDKCIITYNVVLINIKTGGYVDIVIVLKSDLERAVGDDARTKIQFCTKITLAALGNESKLPGVDPDENYGRQDEEYQKYYEEGITRRRRVYLKALSSGCSKYLAADLSF